MVDRSTSTSHHYKELPTEQEKERSSPINDKNDLVPDAESQCKEEILAEADENFRFTQEEVCDALLQRIRPLRRLFIQQQVALGVLEDASCHVREDQLHPIAQAQVQQRDVLLTLSRRLDALEVTNDKSQLPFDGI